jgi:hypothetical protein
MRHSLLFVLATIAALTGARDAFAAEPAGPPIVTELPFVEGPGGPLIVTELSFVEGPAGPLIVTELSFVEGQLGPPIVAKIAIEPRLAEPAFAPGSPGPAGTPIFVAKKFELDTQK